MDKEIKDYLRNAVKSLLYLVKLKSSVKILNIGVHVIKENDINNYVKNYKCQLRKYNFDLPDLVDLLVYKIRQEPDMDEKKFDNMINNFSKLII